MTYEYPGLLEANYPDTINLNSNNAFNSIIIQKFIRKIVNDGFLA